MEGGVPRHAAPVLPPLERRCSSVRKRSPYGCDFLSFSSPPHTFFSSCFYSRKEEPVLHLTITPLHSSMFAWVCCEVEGALIVVE